MKRGDAWETIATDDGVEFVVSIVASFAGRSRWIAHWLRRPHQLDPEANYRMRVVGVAGEFRMKFTAAGLMESGGLIDVLREPTLHR